MCTESSFQTPVLARQNLQARIPSNELLSMKHHTLLSASGSKSKGKTTQNWVCRVVFTPVKHMFSLGFNMCSFAGSMLKFRWLLVFSSTSTQQCHLMRAQPPPPVLCMAWGPASSHTMWTEHALREIPSQACLVFQH